MKFTIDKRVAYAVAITSLMVIGYLVASYSYGYGYNKGFEKANPNASIVNTWINNGIVEYSTNSVNWDVINSYWNCTNKDRITLSLITLTPLIYGLNTTSNAIEYVQQAANTRGVIVNTTIISGNVSKVQNSTFYCGYYGSNSISLANLIDKNRNG